MRHIIEMSKGKGVGARQNNTYENKLRFLRGAIATQSPQPNPKQALVTPSIHNDEGAYSTVVDGRLLLGYHQITAGGLKEASKICCASLS